MNAGRTSDDFRLVGAMASTKRAVFPHVYVIDLPSPYTNSLIYGTSHTISDVELRLAAMQAADPTLTELVERPWSLRSVEATTVVYTDDLAPIERLIDNIILREALGGSTGRQRRLQTASPSRGTSFAPATAICGR